MTGRAGRDLEAGFSLVEVLAASTILILIVISLSHVLVGSLRVALVAKQSEVAASVASDMIENAKALGQVALASAPAGQSSCTASTFGTPGAPVPVPVRTASDIGQCFTIVIDTSSYTVIPTLTAPTGSGPEAVTVEVTWMSGTTPSSYHSTSLVGG